MTQSEQRERKQTATGLEAKGSADAVSVVQTLLPQEEKLLPKEEALACVEHLAGYVEGTQTQIKPSELLKALADSIDVIHERVRKKPAVVMVAAYNKAMTALMPVIPGPSRALREVDIMEDGSVWATLDEGCNTTCHSRLWRENAGAKFLNYGFVVERYLSQTSAPWDW